MNEQNKVWGILTYVAVILVAYLSSWIGRIIRRNKDREDG